MNTQAYTGTQYAQRNTPLPTISGSAPGEIGKQGAIAQIIVGGEYYEVPIDPVTGRYTWTATTPIPDGEYSISVTTKDRAGNIGKPALYTMLVDTTPPEAPLLLNLFDVQGVKTGSFDAGQTTDDKRPTLTGLAQPGTIVYLRDENGNNIGSAQADAIYGKWVMVPSQNLKDGVNNLSLVTEELFAGQPRTGTPSAPVTIIVGADSSALLQNNLNDSTTQSKILGDETATGASIAQPDAIELLVYTGTSYAERNTALPTIAASAPGEIGKTGSIAQIVVGGNYYEIAIDPLTGKYEWTAIDPLPDGDYSVSMIVKDRAGNTGKPTLFTLRIDTTPPEAPDLINMYDGQGLKTGSFDSGDTTDDKQPTLTGVAQKGTTVYLRDASGIIIGSAVADKVTGMWVLVPSVPLKEGVNNLTLIAEETFAKTVRQGVPSDPFTVIIDSTAPINSGIDTVLDNVGSIQDPVRKGGVTDDSTPTLKGKGTPGDIVIIKSNGNQIGTEIIGANSEWSFTPMTSLPDGTYQFTTVVRNPAGNQSSESAPYIVIVDTIALAPIIVKGVDDASGTIANGGKTFDTTPMLEGSGEPGSRVYVEYRDGSGNWTVSSTPVTVNAFGTWSWTAPVLAAGKSWEFRSKIVDVAGNVSAYSTSYKVNIELNFSSGFESFDNQSATINTNYPGHTFKSGIHVVGKAGYADHAHVSDFYSNFGFSVKEAFEWGKGSTTDNIANNSDLRFTLPSLTNKLSFFLGMVDGWVVITTYNAAGQVIESKSFYGDLSIATKDFYFQSTGGIASFSIQGFDEINGMLIDSIRWGQAAVMPLNSYGHDQVDNVIDLNTSPSHSGQSEELINDNMLRFEGDNTLNISAEDILARANTGLFVDNGKHQLLVQGNEGDIVQLIPSNATEKGWVQQSGTVIVSGIEYQVFSNGDAELIVQVGVKVEMPAAPTLISNDEAASQSFVNETSLEDIKIREVLSQSEENLLLTEDESHLADNEDRKLELADILTGVGKIEAWQQPDEYNAGGKLIKDFTFYGTDAELALDQAVHFENI
ncbi:Ig-like domain-containing protein [Pantoea sp. CTOTU49201]|uniref:Ig-like domain-containing protein n=1 Tax=Pantoea sp. CTOTU49201 TaxID=2953855 RepID=UPI00289A4201|nr:Ig-like domain-containing protein [Pantoea sp. CTOTU49201]